MKTVLVIISLLLAGLTSCKDKIEINNTEFIGYWSGGPYNEYGYVSLNINDNSKAHFYISDYTNDHEYESSGTARADGNKLTIGGTKHFTIIEYPHRIDTSVEKKYFMNHKTSRMELANWKMVLDGLKHSSNCNVGERTYYKADY